MTRTQQLIRKIPYMGKTVEEGDWIFKAVTHRLR